MPEIGRIKATNGEPPYGDAAQLILLVLFLIVWLGDSFFLRLSTSLTDFLPRYIRRWGQKYLKLCEWVEENLGETLTFYQLPLQQHKHMKSTHMLERFNEEIKPRTRVVRIFPKAASCLRLIRALAAETPEDWLEASRYLNMEFLKEHQKLRLSLAA